MALTATEDNVFHCNIILLAVAFAQLHHHHWSFVVHDRRLLATVIFGSPLPVFWNELPHYVGSEPSTRCVNCILNCALIVYVSLFTSCMFNPFLRFYYVSTNVCIVFLCMLCANNNNNSTRFYSVVLKTHHLIATSVTFCSVCEVTLVIIGHFIRFCYSLAY